jgi:hypothetical protein
VVSMKIPHPDIGDDDTRSRRHPRVATPPGLS